MPATTRRVLGTYRTGLPAPLRRGRTLGSARLSGAQPTGLVRSVTFPTTRLITRVMIALGADLTASPLSWQWEDITGFLRQDLGVSQTVGRPDGSTRVNYGRATLKLDNRDGRFTRRNPNGPYFGLLSGNTPIWITVDAGSGEKTRIQMFVNDWPTRWSDKSGTDSTVTIQCAGILRRLTQGKTLRSPLRRSLSRSTAVLSYWPLEDGANSTQAASGLSTGTPLVLQGTAPGFASATAPAGSAPVVDFSTGGGGLSGFGQVPTATPTAMRLQLLMKFASGAGAATKRTLMTWTTVGGTYKNWTMSVNASDQLLVEAPDSTGAAGVSMASIGTIYDSTWHRIEVGQRYNELSGDLITYLNLDSSAHATGPLVPPFGVGSTFGYISAVRLNPQSLSGTFMPAMGHLTVVQQDINFAATDPLADNPATDGYSGEQAHVRLARLCLEEGIPFLCLADRSVAMGPQSIAKFVDLLNESETADQGALFETAWGVGYQSVAERTNAAAGLALDFDLGQIADVPQPADDDQRLRNLLTATRSGGGSEASSEQLTGPLRTGAGGPGVYEDSATVNVETDTQIADAAGWLRHIGTVDEDRWPAIPINLSRSPELIDTWTALPYGARITVANPPAQMPPDTIDAIIEGWTEAWTPYMWIASLVTSPFSPYLTGVLAADTGDTDSHLLILTPDTLTLAVGVNATDLTWSVNSSPIWTVNSEYFPRYIWWEGEVIQLTNCVGAAAPQTWTVVRSINGVVKAHLANTSGQVYRPGVLALA